MSRLSLEHIAKRFRSGEALRDVTIAVGEGEVVCLLGPSGCGKSTSLRIAAGVERQDTGTVHIDDRPVSGPQVHLPPEARSIGLMFQDFALFPHLSVAENIVFGLRRTPKAGKTGIAREYLSRVGLQGYGDKYPHELSGGEQQRVALARALAPRPRVMLMDEPFSGLDNRLRDDVRDAALSMLKQEGTAVLLVTHDPEEALRMADRIALMRAGRIMQIGAPYHVYNHPVDLPAAAFFSDVNVLRSPVRDRQAETPFGLFLTPGYHDGATVQIAIRPQHIRMDEDHGFRPEVSARHGIAARGTVIRSRFMGAESLIETAMDHDGSVLKATVPGLYMPPPGQALWLSVRRDTCFLFPQPAQPDVMARAAE